MPRQQIKRGFSLLDQVCDRLSSRLRARRKANQRPAKTFMFESCEPRNMLAGASLVDNFSDPNPADFYFISAFNTNPTLLVQPATPSPGILGGYRDVFVQVLGTANTNSAAGYVGTSGGLGTFDLATASSAPGTEVTLQYSGTNTDTVVGGMLTNGMALNDDLTNGGVNAGLKFDFDFLQIPAGSMGATIDITTTTGNESFTGSIPANPGPPAAFSYYAPFSSFTTTSGTPDLTHVTSVKVVFNSAGTPDVDLELNSIEAAPELSISKVDNRGGSSITPSIGTVTPGSTLSYSVVVSNLGSTAVDGSTVSDPFPSNLTGITYTSVATGGATDTNPTGSGGTLTDTVNLPAGSSITYTVNGTVSSTTTTSLSNTATLTPPVGTPIQATDDDNLLTITKVDDHGGSSIVPSTGTVTPGSPLTYTIVVNNTGPGTVTGAAVSDPFPSNLTGVTYTSTPTGGATDTNPTGSGSLLADSVTLPPNSSITYTVTGTVAATANTSLSNTATVTATNGTTTHATDVDNLLTITKVDNRGGSSIVPSTGTVTPGSSLTYTIVVSNTGPDTVAGAAVSDPFPGNLTGVSYKSVATGGATDSNPTGSGGTLTDTVTLPAGSTITYTVTGTVATTATTSLSNTATVTATNGATAQATDNDNLLTITKVDDRGGSSITPSTGTVTPGSSLTYTIVVSNTGPGTVTGASVSDPFPSNLTGITYTSVPTGGATDSNPTGSGSSLTDTVTLPSGSTIIYTVTGTVAATANTSLSNTATVTATNGTTTQATDNDNLLTITKVDNRGGSSIAPSTGTVTPGSSLTYTIVVSNTGPDTVTGAAVSDPFPGNLTGVSYTSVATGGATDTDPTGSGSTLSDTVTLPAGSSIIYTVMGTVATTATTSLSNTATVTATNGTTAQATDNDNLLTITKVDDRGGSSIVPSTGTVTPGSSLTYTIVVSNTGPGTVTGANVSDPFPTNLTGITYTSVPTGGATDSNPTGSGSTLTDTVTLPSGSSITYTVTGTVSATANTSLSNTATVTATNGTTTQATDNDSLLTITKVDNRGGSSIAPSTGTVTPGSSLTYTIVVSNTGPGDVTGATVNDPFPGNLTGISYTSVATGGATDSDPTGSGATLADTVTLPAGSSIIYTVTGTVATTATASLSNTATVTATNGTTTQATDNDNLLTITKVDNRGGSSIVPSTGTVTPGSSLTYTIVVSNTGPGTVTAATVSDPFPTNLTGVTYTSVAAGGATDSMPSGSGSTLTDTVTLPAGSSITYTVMGTVSATANTSLSNSATVTATNGTSAVATDNDNLLTITKVDNRGGSSIAPSTGTVTPGSSLTYTIVVSNTGPDAVTGATVNDPFPANLTNVSYTSVAAGGATDSNPTGSGSTLSDTVTLPSGSSITYTVTGTVASTATTSLSNTATVTATNGTTTQATDNDNLLTITKVDNRGGSSITPSTGTVTPGSTLTYTIVVSNTGPTTVTGASVSDPFPGNLTGITYTSVPAGGATDSNPTGSGGVLTDMVTLPAGSSITYTVMGTVTTTATTSLSNTATVTATNGATASATDNDNLLTITKVDNRGGSSIVPSTGTVTPGSSLTYTIVVSNTGPDIVTGATVSDPFPGNLTNISYTSVATGGATDSDPTGSGGTLTDTVTLPAGSTITYTVTGTVSSTATTSLSNTATVTATNGTTTQATDNDNLLTITKVDNRGGSSITPSTGTVTPGSTLTYTIVVSNTGPTTVTGASVSDPFPGNLTGISYTSVPAGGATDSNPTGSGSTLTDTVTLPAGSSITYTVMGTVATTATTSLSNTAMVTATNGAAASATDNDNLLTITKVDNLGGSSITPSTGTVTPGTSLTYTIVVSNTGPDIVTGAAVSDPFPANLTGITYTSVPTGGATDSNPTGSGPTLTDTVTLPAGSTIIYTVTGTVSSTATTSLSNTATVTATNGTTTQATDNDNLLTITKVDDHGGSSIIPSTGTVMPGNTLTYTIVVSNTGPDTVTAASVTDPFPSNVTGITYTSVPAGGATDSDPTGSGPTLSDTVTLPAGSSITYTVVGTVSLSAVGMLSNTATVTATNGATTNATDLDNIIALPNLSIVKSDNAGGSSVGPTTGNVTPGQTLVYTIVVTNSGPGVATGASITDPFPANFLTDTYTASATGGASGFTPSGSGNINDLAVDMPAGSTITYVVTGTVSSTATGTLTNTATTTPPGGTPVTATDVDDLANLSITKVDNAGGSSIVPSTGNVTPGQTLIYTIVVGNSGPGSITGASVTDPLPATFLSGTYTTVLAGGATDSAPTGSGNISDTVNLPAGATITYIVTGTVSGTATGTMTNTATVTPTAGTPKNATDVDNLANLSITKVDNAGGSSITPSTGNVIPGQSMTYTIVVSNSGPGSVTGASVTDPFPANFQNATYTTVLAGGATDSAPTGSGNISDTVTLPSGATITYTVTGTISSAATGTLSNTATVTPTAGTPKNATDTDNIANLSITKVDNAGGSSITPSTGNVIPGQSLTYTIVVTNSGPGFVNGASVTDPFPANFQNATYTTVLAGGATDSSPTGSGNINDTVTLPSGATITYTVTGTVSSAATGTLNNTATVTPPAGTPKNATDVDNIANLSITKVDNAGGSSITPSTGNVIPGQTLVYTVVVSNSGPGSVTGASVTDPFPANFQGATYTTVLAGGATDSHPTGSGNISDTVTLPSGSSIIYVVTGTVSSAATGTLTNTATVTPPVGTPKNATDVDNLANLSITKVDNAGGSSITPSTGNVVPGQSLTYTIVVSNSGPGTVTGASVTDPFPANFQGATYTTVLAGGATDSHPTGSGNISDTVTLPSGATITYTVTGTVSSAATGTLSNTATVTPPVGTPKNATDIDNLANLAITKVDNAGGSSIVPTTGNVTPGQTLIYTIVVSNSGPGSVTGASITDPLPANFTSDTYTATATGGATGFTANGTGNINDLSVNMPSGSTITYVVTGTVSSAATGTLTNTATVTPPVGTPKNATDIDNLANLSITKVDNAGGSSIVPTTGNVTPGQTLIYTIVVSNTGPGSVTGANVNDPLPANFTSDTYTATATGGATGFTPSGSGNINDTVILPSGSTITYVVTGTVSSAATGTLTNTATVTPPSGTPKHATDIDNLANLSITKVDNAGGSSIIPSTGTVSPGQSLTYTIVVSNTGLGNVTGASVTDPFPANFTSDTFTATATGGATGFTASGTGNINDTAVNLPAGSSVTYVVVGTVSGTATGTLTNVATVTPPAGTPKNATDKDNIVPAALSGFVYVDSNNNGIKDPGELPIAGVTVVLTGTATGGGAVNITTNTDGMGFYSFPNLSAGNYTITETQPTNFIDGKDAVGSQNSGTIVQGATTNAIQNITLTAGTNGVNNNFGNLGLTPQFTSKRDFINPNNPPNLGAVQSLSGYAYSEATAGSPVYDPANPPAGETPLAGVTITLTGPGGTKTTTTTAAGAYSFTNLATGSYTITETTPTGFSSQTAFVGSQGTGTASAGAITGIQMTPNVSGINNDFPNLALPANLTITKVDNAGGSSITPTTGNVTPGQSLTYTVVVSNTGTGNATGATITDPLPANLTGDTWTATATGGATGFLTTGTGNIDDTNVSMPAGSKITYVITGTVNSAATGTLSNTATVTPSTGTAASAVDNDNLANLSITKVDNAGGSSITPSTGNVTPGQSLTYTVVVSNTGTGNVTGATIADPLPANFTSGSWTATATGGATGFSATGTGNIDDTSVNMPAGSKITYVVTGTVSAAATGTLSNTATVTPTGGTAKSATDNDNLANLSITKVDNAGGSSITPSTGNVTPGGSLTYTVVVSNTGTGNVTGATIADPLPANFTSGSWTATATGGATGFSASGTGNIDDTSVNMPAGSTITYVVTGTVSAGAAGTLLSNTATITPTGGAAKSATDNDNVNGVPNVTITKVDNAGGSSITPLTGNVIPGQTLTYTIVVSNTGTGAAPVAAITDPFPSNFTGATWTASATGGASGFSTSGNGNINDTSVNLPAGSTITYVVTGTVSAAATGTLSNTATVAPNGEFPKMATDNDNLANLSITKVDDVGGSSITGAIGDLTPPGTITYTVVVSNTGTGNVASARIADPMPSQISSDSWTATATGGASGFSTNGNGNIDDLHVNMPAGSTITYVITANVSAVDDVETMANTATVTPSVGTSKSATDTITLFEEIEVASPTVSPAVSPAVASSNASSSSATSSSSSLNAAAVDAALAGGNGGSNSTTTGAVTTSSAALTDAALLSLKGSLLGL